MTFVFRTRGEILRLVEELVVRVVMRIAIVRHLMIISIITMSLYTNALRRVLLRNRYDIDFLA